MNDTYWEGGLDIINTCKMFGQCLCLKKHRL